MGTSGHWGQIWATRKSCSHNMTAVKTNYKVLICWCIVHARLVHINPNTSKHFFLGCLEIGSFFTLGGLVRWCSGIQDKCMICYILFSMIIVHKITWSSSQRKSGGAVKISIYSHIPQKPHHHKTNDSKSLALWLNLEFIELRLMSNWWIGLRAACLNFTEFRNYWSPNFSH